MKTTIKITAIMLAFVTLTACTKKDEDDSRINIPEVTPSSISGTWKITVADANTEPDKNGMMEVADLLEKGYKSCEYSSPIVITENTFTIKTGGKNCTPDNKDIVYTYKYIPGNKRDNGTIELSINNKTAKILKNVYLRINNNEKKQLYFLKQNLMKN